MEDKIRSMEEENLALQKRLERLNMAEGLIKKKKKKKNVKITTIRSLQPHTKNEFDDVSSKINPDLIDYKKKQKEIKQRKEKKAMEMKNCTFKPNVNENSKKYVNSGHYVPIHKRKLPEKKETRPKVDKEVEEFERIQAELKKNKPKGKVNINEFYKKQVDWDKQKKNKQNRKRLDKALKEHTAKRTPNVNKKKNDALVANKGTFLKRVGNNMEKSKKTREKLEQKYNTNSFKPKINRNVKVESLVTKFINGEWDGKKEEEEGSDEEGYEQQGYREEVEEEHYERENIDSDEFEIEERY